VVEDGHPLCLRKGYHGTSRLVPVEQDVADDLQQLDDADCGIILKYDVWVAELTNLERYKVLASDAKGLTVTEKRFVKFPPLVVQVTFVAKHGGDIGVVGTLQASENMGRFPETGNGVSGSTDIGMDKAQLVKSPTCVGALGWMMVRSPQHEGELQSLEGTGDRYCQAKVEPGHGLEGDA